MIYPPSNILDLAFLTRLYQAWEEERRITAGELHDRLSQQLAGLKMDIFRLDRKLPSKDDFLVKKLAGMMEIVDAAVESVRNISADLHPGILEDAGLPASMEWYSGEFTRQFAVPVAFKSDPLPFEINPDVSINLFRVYQGLLARSLAYPGIKRITATLMCNDLYLMLTLKQDNPGDDRDQSQTRPLTADLAGRLLLLSGECSLENEPGNGSSVWVGIPIEKLITPCLKPIS